VALAPLIDALNEAVAGRQAVRKIMDELVAELRARLGPDAVLEGEDAHAKAISFWSRLGQPRAVLLPRTARWRCRWSG
jgi:hypothetical protein